MKESSEVWHHSAFVGVTYRSMGANIGLVPVNLKQTCLEILCLPFRKTDGGASPRAPIHLVSSCHGEQPEAKPAPSLYRATPGSAGLDLCAPTDSILAPEDGVQILSTGVFWLPPPNTYFLILGRALNKNW